MTRLFFGARTEFCFESSSLNKHSVFPGERWGSNDWAQCPVDRIVSSPPSPSVSHRPSVQNCCPGGKPTRSTQGAAGPVPASDFVRGNNLHVSALTFQIRHHRLGCRAGLFFKIHQKVPSMHQAFEITLRHSVLEVKKKINEDDLRSCCQVYI